MKLSQIDTTVYYPVEIPSSKLKTKFRPFIVKEEKALLTAQESENIGTMLVTLEEIVRSCVKDCPKELTTFDVEYLFIQIRSKSVGEQSRVVVSCKECGADNNISVDLTKVKISENAGETNIRLNDRLVVKMKYPSLATLAELTKDNEPDIQKTLASSIDSVFFENEVIRVEETSLEDLMEFIEKRTDPELTKLLEFIENIPTVSLETEYECRQCAAENKVKLTSLADFF